MPKSTRIPLAFKDIPSSTLAGPSNPSSRRALQLFDLASTPTPTNRPSLPLSSPLSNGFKPSTGLGRDSRQDNDLDRYPDHLSQSLLPVCALPTPGDHEDDEPPRKYRRASEGNRVPSGSSIGARPSPAAAIPAPTITSKPRQRRRSSLETSRSRSHPRVGDKDRERDRERVLDKENTSASYARNSERRKSDGDIEKDQDQDRSYDIEKNGKGKEKATLTKKGPLEDYSIYKGRGRYGKGKDKDRGYVHFSRLYPSSLLISLKGSRPQLSTNDSRLILRVMEGWNTSMMKSCGEKRSGSGCSVEIAMIVEKYACYFD